MIKSAEEAIELLSKLPNFQDSLWVHEPSAASGYLTALEGPEVLAMVNAIKDRHEWNGIGTTAVSHNPKTCWACVALTPYLNSVSNKWIKIKVDPNMKEGEWRLQSK